MEIEQMVSERLREVEAEERSKAEALLRDPLLLENINKELGKQIVGEECTRLAIFLSQCSIWAKGATLHVIVNSESSSGKDWVCRRVLDLFPKKLVFSRTKVSPEAFSYWHDSDNDPAWSWDGKCCYIADARDSLLNSDTFKVMCSEGSSATIVVKNKAVDIKVKGKPNMLLTTAIGTPKAEILNRFAMLSLDESEGQTKAIIQRKFQNAESIANKETDNRIPTALKHLERKPVIIPFSGKLAKHFPTSKIRFRRDVDILLALIKASAALHQFQRESIETAIVANEQDYELARKIMPCFSSGMILGLTRQEKEAYETCLAYSKNNTLQPTPFTAKEIHAYNPFVSEREWYNLLGRLSTKKALTVKLEKRDEFQKRVTTYWPEEFSEQIMLPPFEQLEANEPKENTTPLPPCLVKH